MMETIFLLLGIILGALAIEVEGWVGVLTIATIFMFVGLIMSLSSKEKLWKCLICGEIIGEGQRCLCMRENLRSVE